MSTTTTRCRNASRAALFATAAAAALAATASTASAQHANFRLLGDAEAYPSVNFGPPENKFVAPITNATYHEDAFITTDIRLAYSYHEIADESAFIGGDIQMYHLQARLALTDQFQVLLYRSGFMDINSDAPTDDFGGTYAEEGALDLGLGLKWKFLSDWQNQLHMAVGIGYDLPVGSPAVAQNDDELRFWYSVNKGFGRFHLGGTINYVKARGPNQEFLLGNSDFVSWHLHTDYYISRDFSAVVELNGYHQVGGDDLVLDSGQDLFNLAGGDEVFTIGVGGEYRPIDNLGLRAAVEFPLEEDGDELFDWRVILGFTIGF